MTTLSILHTEASLGWGGQEIRILTEAAGTARRGHSVLLAAPAEARIFQEAARFGVNAVALPIGKKGVRGVMALRTLLAKQRFNVINTHSSTDTWLASLALRTSSTHCALVRTRHISAPIPPNRASRWLYTHASHHIVTTGAALREQVIRETGVSADRVTSVPTGIDLDRYFPGVDRAAVRAALGITTPGCLVAIVATLRSWKGHRYLIEAIAALPDMQLVIVGDGPQRAALVDQVAAAGLQARVRFAGNQDDVVPWLQAADLFCLPSYANEGVPQALMQAMACGLPVISTPVGAITEIVTHGQTGLIVPAQAVAPLREALAQLRDAPSLRQSYGDAGRARAMAAFGLARMVDAMEEAFRCAILVAQADR
jgi:glycosyltransferase involved in cell wall biosynthesis